MISLLLALQKIAKPGDGLHPDLLRVLESLDRSLLDRPTAVSLDAVRLDRLPVIPIERVLDQVNDKSNVVLFWTNDTSLGEHSSAEFPHEKRLFRLAQNI